MAILYPNRPFIPQTIPSLTRSFDDLYHLDRALCDFTRTLLGSLTLPLAPCAQAYLFRSTPRHDWPDPRTTSPARRLAAPSTLGSSAGSNSAACCFIVRFVILFSVHLPPTRQTSIFKGHTPGPPLIPPLRNSFQGSASGDILGKDAVRERSRQNEAVMRSYSGWSVLLVWTSLYQTRGYCVGRVRSI